jgi:hypothetical protein
MITEEVVASGPDLPYTKDTSAMNFIANFIRETQTSNNTLKPKNNLLITTSFKKFNHEKC